MRSAQRPPQDDGSTHVLEAVIVASLMVSAVAFVVTFEIPPPSVTDGARGELAQRAKDVLAIMADTPIESEFGEDELSAYIAQCLNEKCSDLEQKIEALVPDGASYALYVSNGQSTYPIVVKGKPEGESVSATRSFEPMWSSTFLATATDSITAGDPLLTYALPVFNSVPVTQGGSQLLVKVTGQRAQADYVLIGAAATSAQDADDQSARAVSLYFVDAAGNPLAILNSTAGKASAQPMTLRVKESQGGILPEGVQVDIDIPRGWRAIADQTKNNGWKILENATDLGGAYVGSTIRATLLQEISSSYKDLTFDATYEGDALDYYPFYARLSRNATASAAMLVRGETHGDPPALATPIMVMSTPAPIGNGKAGATTQWTLGVYIPVTKTQVGGNEIETSQTPGSVTITDIEIREKDGHPIFANVRPEITTGPSGETLADAARGHNHMGGVWQPEPSSTIPTDTLLWSGNVELHYGEVLNLTFNVTASGEAGPSDARNAFVPPVQFDTWTGKLMERVGWGFSRGTILAPDGAYGGYETAAGYHDVSSPGVYRSTELPGAIKYKIDRLDPLIEDALYGSYVTAEDRTVPTGGKVIINANVQSVLYLLAQAGQKAGVTLRFYPPWAGDERKPIFEQENLDQGILNGEITQVVLTDVNGDGIPDPVVGTTNGRVLAYHGLTGQRLQGNTFTAPVSDLAAEQKLLARINVLATIKLDGQEYVVVGPDENSDGIFVLDKKMSIVWQYPLVKADTLAIASDVDVTGDGRPDVVVARYVDRAKSAVVHVLEALPGESLLVPYVPQAVAEDAAAFFVTPGTPSTIGVMPRIGPFGDRPGLVVPIQSLVEPGVTTTVNPDDPVGSVSFDPNAAANDPAAAVQVPVGTHEPSSTPRAGVQGLNNLAEPTSTLFGAPAAVLRAYDYGGDTVDDLAFGGTSGYVFMVNGTVLTQPLYSYLVKGSPAIISADTHTSVDSYTLMMDGQIMLTHDAWASTWLLETAAPGARAIAANAKNSLWLVGTQNRMWDSFIYKPEQVLADEIGEEFPEVRPYTPTLPAEPTFFASRLYDFNDVSFRGDEGWVVGSTCIVPLAALDTVPKWEACTEPIIITTSNGGQTWSRVHGYSFNEPVTQNLNRIKFFPTETGFIVGDGGTLLRNTTGKAQWEKLTPPTTNDLKDIACKPPEYDTCIIVGEAGTVIRMDHARGSPSFDDRTGRDEMPTSKDLASVGYASPTRVYAGSKNAVYANFDDAGWTALPLNYIENDANVVNGLGDGTGFVYGGGPGNARMWLLHDYHIQSQAQTLVPADRFGLPADAKITQIRLAEGDATLVGQEVIVNVSTSGDAWETMGPLVQDDVNPNRLGPLTHVHQASGRDVRFRFVMNTSGDSTVLSPHLRSLDFDLDYTAPCSQVPGGTVVGTQGAVQVCSGVARASIDFRSDALLDRAVTTADWNTTLGALRQSLVQEYWVRSVGGEVIDIQTGFNVAGDGRNELWVGTGDVLSENSPDYIIYAGTDTSKVISADNRIYLLDGANGAIRARTGSLKGEVRAIRLVDEDENKYPELVVAMCWDSTTSKGYVYGFNATTLASTVGGSWISELGSEEPHDLEIRHALGTSDVAFTGTTAITDGYAPAEGTPDKSVYSRGKLWRHDPQTGEDVAMVIADRLGHYRIETTAQSGWLYGPYVVEIEVEWEEQVTGEQGGATPGASTTASTSIASQSSSELQSAVRSARFYDYFTVTPPELLGPASPVYDARLLVWMQDWG